MDPHRHKRVSESIREELEEMISFELTDPRVGSCSIAEVHVSPDYRHAHVMLVPAGTEAEQLATVEGVNHAKQFLKYQLAERLQLYKTPDLHFEAALSAGLGAKANQILKRIKRGRPRDEKKPLS